jgi:hypothetical protein
VAEAREAVGRAEDSLRLNPRRRLLGDPSDELREGMTTLEHAAILVRGICRSLVALDTVTGGDGPDPGLPLTLGRLLREVAGAIRTFGEVVAASVPGPPANQAPLLRALARARAGRDEVAAAMAAGPRDEPGAWQVHGHLLANVDRLVSELDPEGTTWPGTGGLP